MDFRLCIHLPVIWFRHTERDTSLAPGVPVKKKPPVGGKYVGRDVIQDRPVGRPLVLLASLLPHQLVGRTRLGTRQ